MKNLASRRDLTARLKKIRCLLLDVDGVLTDGKLYFSNTGQESKSFDVQDGHGIAMALRTGLLVGFVTGRPSRATAKRAADLGVKILHQGAVNKMDMVNRIKAEHGLRDEEICFVGDELVDLPVLRRVGLAVAVPNAVAEVKASAHYLTRHTGGAGAVREVIEMLLKATGRWDKAIAKYLTVLLAGLMLVTGGRAETNVPTASGYIEKFVVPERDDAGNLKWKLSGDRATFRPDGLMDIINARAELYTSNKVSLIFTTPILVLDRANSRAATDAPVRIERENLILTGIGGDWSGSNTEVVVRKNVQMVITGAHLLSPQGDPP
ncbi:MAG: HAD hydrolase family protein [Verrucomicrobiota bacterium]